MAQVSYGSITIIDTNDIERIYTVYAKSNSNIEIPLIEVQNWSESITLAPGEGDYIWQRTVVQKTSIEEKSYSEPVCLTGSSGQSVDSISTYYCNYSNGRPEEDYEGWQGEIPQYDEDKPYYWIKTIIIFTDSTKKTIVESGEIISVNLTQESYCKSLKASIEPIQDLHGYDKPWSGGNGANKWDEEWEVGHIAGGVPQASTNAIRSKNFCECVAGATYYVTCGKTDGGTDNRYYLCIFFYDENQAYITGSYAYCNNQTVTAPTNAKYFKICTNTSTVIYGNTYHNDICVNNPSTVTTYSPYSNICPISGRTEVVTSRCGVNVWDEEWRNGYYNNSGVFASNANYVANKNPIPVLPNTEYYFTINPTPQSQVGRDVFYYDESGNFISKASYYSASAITTPSNCHFINFNLGAAYGNTYKNDISINYPSTDHDYHAYNGTQYTTDLGRTVYGGTLDVVSGVLTVDRANIDMGSLTWTYSNSFFRTDGITATVKRPPNNQTNVNAICSAYPIMTWTAISGTDTAIAVDTTGRMIVANPNITSLSDFQTAISGVQLCYELATPQTIQLTPQEVELLKGTNNLWCDAGDIEVNIITISNRDVIIRQDNGITEAIAQSVEANANAATALSISQHANEDSQGAMAQAASNVSEIKRIWYAQSAATPAPAAPTTGITTTAAHDAWSITKPAPNNDYQYYFYCDQTKTGGGVYSWSEVILDTSNLSQYQIGALTTKVRNYWWDSNGAHIASGTSSGEEITASSPVSDYGYNTLTGLTGISFRYNNAKVVDLNSTTPSLDFYQPPTISGSTVTQGKKTMMLSANALKFYDPTNGTTEQAVLDSNGLLLKEGGVKSGSVNAGNSGFVYLSTKNYGSNLTINGHQASNWREVIGTKFGVDANGNLYASNADISGKITVGSGSNVSTTDEMNSAIGDAIDDIEIGGRNYVTLASRFGQENTTNGGTTKVLSDSTIVANGTFTATTLVLNATILTGVQLEAGTYQLWATNPNFCHFRLGTTTSGTYWKEGDYSKDSPCKITVSTSQYVTIGITVSAGTYSNEATRIMLEKGTMVTDWTPAPEDVQAEIDAKKNIHTLTSSNTNGAEYTTILGWCAEGATGSWSVTSTAGVKTGDTVRIAYIVSNMGTADDRPVVYCIGTVTNIWSETSLQMISHGLDSTVIDGGHILTGTIDASKVNVTNLNANNISGGTLNINYIPADARNSNISIGGENLLKDNSYLYLTSYNCAILKLTENLVAGQTYTLQLWGISFTNTPNTNNFIGVYLGGGSQSLGSITSFSNGYGYLTFTPTTANIAHADSRRGFIYLYNTTPSDSKTSRQITITKWKLEKGNKPTDWSPAPSDRAGNANLLRGTMQMLDGVGSYASGTFRASGGTLSHGNFGAGSEIPVNGLTGFIRTQNYTSSATSVGIAQDGIPPVDIRTGTFFTLSCWVRGTAGVEVYLQPLWKSATQHAGNSPSAQRRILSGIWSFIQYTGVLIGDQITDGISGGYVYGYNVPVNGYVDICGLKLEVGSAASGWNTGIGSDMVTRIDDSGIHVHPMGTIANRIEINANGFNVYKADTMRVSVDANTIRLRSPNGGFPQVAVDANEAWFAYAANDWATLNSNGFNIVKSGTSVAFYGDTARVGKEGKERVIIDASGVGIYDKNNYRRATFDATGIRLYGTDYGYPTVNVNETSSGVYLDNNNYSIITSSGLNVVKGGTNVANFSTSARIGATTVGNKYVIITSSGLYVRKQVDASTTKDYLTLTDGWCCFGDPAASRITCNTTGDSPYFYMNAAGVNALYADSTGVKVGNYNENYSYIKSDGLHVYQSSTEVAFFGENARVGALNNSNIVVTPAGIIGNSSNNEYFDINSNGGQLTTTTYQPIIGASGSSAITINLSNSSASYMWAAIANGGTFSISITFRYRITLSNNRYSYKQKTVATGFTKGTAKSSTYVTYDGANSITLTTSFLSIGGLTYVGRNGVNLGKVDTTNTPFYRFGHEVAESGGAYCFLVGNGTTAEGNYQLACGAFNANNTNAYFIVGDGTSDTARSNAFVVDKSGNATVQNQISATSGSFSRNIALDGYVNATGGYYISGHKIGQVLTANIASAISMANNSGVQLCTLSIPAGTWIITGQITFDSNSSGIRRIAISPNTNADIATINAYAGMQTSAASAGQTVLNASYILTTSSTVSYYLYGLHNRGSALNATSAILKAVRIG